MQLVNDINPHIFRGYDIRGEVDKDLTEDVMYTLGRGYATWLSKRRIDEVPVGRDNRLSSDVFTKAFMQGLNEGGCHTVDIGLSLSQIVYFASYHFTTKAGAMITASHNPKNYNGLKLSTNYSETMVTEEIQELRQLIESGNYSQGNGSHRVEDIFPQYQKTILKHFTLHKHWRIVVDTCNTTSGIFYPTVFKGGGCEVFEQNTLLDGNFPLGVPDPTEMEVLNRLAEGVKKYQADIGFAFDADGDRIGVVDETGRVLWMDNLVSIFAQDILDFMPGSSIIYNTLCSRQVTEAIESAGGKPIMWLTGHSFIKAKVKETKSPFGGELSGHIFFMDNFFGHDDGAFACLRLMQYLERTNQTLSQAVNKLSQYISSPEIKFGLADDIKFQFIKNTITPDFKKTWPSAQFIDIDGIRFDLPDQMAILRASQNGPYITLKFEHKTKAGYEQLKQQLKTIMKQYPEIDWSIGVNTHVLD